MKHEEKKRPQTWSVGSVDRIEPPNYGPITNYSSKGVDQVRVQTKTIRESGETNLGWK